MKWKHLLRCLAVVHFSVSPTSADILYRATVIAEGGGVAGVNSHGDLAFRDGNVRYNGATHLVPNERSLWGFTLAGINDEGLVVGFGEHGPVWSPTRTGFTYDLKSRVFDYFPMGQEGARDEVVRFNNLGQVALGESRWSYIYQVYDHGIRYFPGVSSWSSDLNEAGAVLVTTSAGYQLLDLRTDARTSPVQAPRDLPVLINERGDLFIDDWRGGAVHLVNLHEDERSLVTLTKPQTYKIADLNNTGILVGGSTDPLSSETRATALIDHVLHDLNTVTSELGGWTLTTALKVNDAGQIFASARDGDERLAFLRLDPFVSAPVPEPRVIGVWGTTLLFLAIAVRRRDRTAQWSARQADTHRAGGAAS